MEGDLDLSELSKDGLSIILGDIDSKDTSSIMDKFTKDEKKLINEVLEDLHEYIDDMEKGAEEEGKDLKSFLFKLDWFLDFCKEYKTARNNGKDTAGLELGFIINFDMWINDSNCWPVYKPVWKEQSITS